MSTYAVECNGHTWLTDNYALVRQPWADVVFGAHLRPTRHPDRSDANRLAARLLDAAEIGERIRSRGVTEVHLGDGREPTLCITANGALWAWARVRPIVEAFEGAMPDQVGRHRDIELAVWHRQGIAAVLASVRPDTARTFAGQGLVGWLPLAEVVEP